MYDFSIIIPHKNTPELLERCLASIPQRADTQTIVVDDSSDERIVDFARFPGVGRADTEIIFHKSPIGGATGAGVARNVGLGAARGRWVVFADADDFFHADVFSQLLDSQRDTDADIVFFRHDSVDSDTGEQVHINRRRLLAIDQFEKTGDQTRLRYLTSVPWGKLIRRQLLDSHQIRFDEVRYSAAVNFSLKAGFFAGPIAIDNAVAYCNTRREGGLTHEGRGDWAAMAVRFEADRRASVFAHEHGLGTLLDANLFDRWIRLRHLDRRRTRSLTASLRGAVSRRRMLKFIFLGR